jgi:GNAT superfamily N-acetyltransferase
MNSQHFTSQGTVVRFGFDRNWMDLFFELYNRTDLKRGNKDQVQQAFINSQVVASIWQNDRPIAIGRAISDFKMYSGIYDVVVDPLFQKQGLGKIIMQNLLERLQGTCVFLTSTFGNEQFYKNLGFRFHKSALALYPERMQNTPYLHHNFKIPSDLALYHNFQVTTGKVLDIEGCYDLNEQLGYQSDLCGFTKRFRFLLGSPEHEIIIATENSKVVAWMHLGINHILEDEDFAQLAAIIVSEDKRSSGLGAHFLKIAEVWAKFHGYSQIRLHSSIAREQAHKFYLKNGYSHTKSSKLFVKELS